MEQRRLPRGGPVELGRQGELAIPLPVGASYLARIEWVDRDRVVAVDARARQYVVDPDNDVDLQVGPISLTLSLAPQFALRRAVPLSTVASVAWLAIVLLFTLGVDSGNLVYENRCRWLGMDCASADDADAAMLVTAEYLARLLKEDYAGADEGVVSKDMERPEAERKTRDDFYLPAGNDGPIEDMGGAEEQAPTPIRTPEEVEEQPVPTVAEAVPLYTADDTQEETLEERLTPDPEQGDDIGLEAPEIDPEDGMEAPAEEDEGWGIQDWYDEQDERLDSMEIELYIRAAQHQLRIDPNDPYALSVLSYYQYLAEDFDAAVVTYDKYIALLPDEAAGYNNKALIYKRRGEYESEQKLYQIALALDPGDSTAMNNLAVNLAHQGRFEEAIAIMNELEVLTPDDPYADLHRAKIWAEMGEPDKALYYLELALKGMAALDTLHHIEFRQDIRIDPSFAKLRETGAFRDVLVQYYGEDSPLQE